MRTLKRISMVLVALTLLVMGPWAFLSYKFPDKSCQPLDYRACPEGRTKGCGRDTHCDRSPKWLFCKIKRSKTTFCVPMGPTRVAGNQDLKWVPEQDCYPMAKDAEFRKAQMAHHIEWGVKREYKAYQPVPDINKWVVLSAPILPARIPVYIAVSFRAFRKRVHANFGLKPDFSLTPERWKESDGPIKDVWGDRVRPDNGCHVGDSAWNWLEMSTSMRDLKLDEQNSFDFGPGVVALVLFLLVVKYVLLIFGKP